VVGASKSEARRLVEQGGVSINDRKIADVNARLRRADALDGRVFVLRKGARQRFVIRLT
jgi:tyrosyl-tRNA synthetase